MARRPCMRGAVRKMVVRQVLVDYYAFGRRNITGANAHLNINVRQGAEGERGADGCCMGARWS